MGLIDNACESESWVGSRLDAKRDPKNLDDLQRYQCDGLLQEWSQYCARFYKPRETSGRGKLMLLCG